MRGTWARYFVTRVCVVLLLALGLAGCATNGISDPGMYGTATSTLQAGSYGSVSEAPDKLHKVTIVQVTDNAQSTDAAQKPAAGQKYWTVKVFLENKGKVPITPGQTTLRTTAGSDYNATTVPGLTEPFGKPTLNRGAQATAIFVFEIPQDAHPKWVKYLPDPSQDTGIQFST